MPLAGVTRLADVTGLDVLGIPVHLAVRPCTRSLAVSVGKGMDAASARTAALMESLEVWCAENLEIPGRVATFEELTDNGMTAVDPDTLPLALDAEPTGHRQRLCTWIPGADALSGRRVWVPLDVVSLDFRLDRLAAPWLARNSNGLASGNTRAEAMRHALCEVIERDAEWRWRTSDDERRIALATVRDAGCRWLLDRFAEHGVYVAAWDVTSAVGLPVMGCVIFPDPDRADWFGMGAHDGFCCRPDPAAALEGALLEAAQKRLTYISGSRDDVTREEMARAHDANLVRRVWDELHTGEENTDFASVRSYMRAGADADVTVALETLQRAGFAQVVVVDVADPDPGPCVVKALVPRAYGPYGSALAPARPLT
jgi:YcaO-like protein with predicted kinase domain